MINLFAFISLILLFWSNPAISMAADTKHVANTSTENTKTLIAKSDRYDSQELTKWYKESFITKEDFYKKISSYTQFPKDIANILYDYVWLFNTKQVSSQTFDYNRNALSKDGKYLAISNKAKILDEITHSIIIKKLKENNYEDFASQVVFCCQDDDGLRGIAKLIFSPNNKYLVSLSGNIEMRENYDLKIWSFNDKDFSLNNAYSTEKYIPDIQFDSTQSKIFFVIVHGLSNRDGDTGLIKFLNLKDNSIGDLVKFENFLGFKDNFAISSDNNFAIGCQGDGAKLTIFDLANKSVDNLNLPVKSFDPHDKMNNNGFTIDVSIYVLLIFYCSNQEIIIVFKRSTHDNPESFLVKYNFITKEIQKEVKLGNSIQKVVHNTKILLAYHSNFNQKIHNYINELLVYSLDDLNPFLFNLTLDENYVFEFVLTDDGKLITTNSKGFNFYETSLTKTS